MSNNIRIAISGMSGCGNTTVTGLVAEKLGLKAVNYTFRDLAEEMGLRFDELRRLSMTDPQYDRRVDTEQVRRAMEAPCVLGSRLAVWFLKEADLKVYLTAPVDVRAGRVAGREGGELAEVMRKTRERDEQDSRRYRELYHIDNTDYAFVDMVIDAGAHDQYEIADMIVNRALEILQTKENGRA